MGLCVSRNRFDRLQQDLQQLQTEMKTTQQKHHQHIKELETKIKQLPKAAPLPTCPPTPPQSPCPPTLPTPPPQSPTNEWDIIDEL